jgi:hypothetical protein
MARVCERAGLSHRHPMTSATRSLRSSFRGRLLGSMGTLRP